MHKKFRLSVFFAIICCGLLMQSCFRRTEVSKSTGWKINGEIAETSATYTFTATEDIEIEAFNKSLHN